MSMWNKNYTTKRTFSKRSEKFSYVINTIFIGLLNVIKQADDNKIQIL